MKWKEPTKRQKADWEGKLLLDIVDISTAVIRFADQIAVLVCKITDMRDELIMKLTGATPETASAAIRAWQEMATLKCYEEWPRYSGVPMTTSKPIRKRKTTRTKTKPKTGTKT